MTDFNFDAFIASIPEKAWMDVRFGEAMQIALVDNGPEGVSVCFRILGGRPKVFAAGLVAQLCASIDTSARPAIDGAKSARVN